MKKISQALRRGLSLVALALDRSLPFLALALIAAGSWFIYAPAAPLAVGLLIWVDLHRKDSKP